MRPGAQSAQAVRPSVAFGPSFTDAQVAEIAAYLRARFTDQPAWSKLPAAVAAARKEPAA